MSKTKEPNIFSKITGDIITYFLKLEDSKRQEIVELQVNMHAIKLYQDTKDITLIDNFYRASKEDISKAVIQHEKDIQPYLVQAKNDIEKKNNAPKGIPVIGQLAVSLGMVNRKIMDILLLAQAAQRICAANLDVEEYRNFLPQIFMDHSTEEKDQAPDITQKSFARLYIDKEKNASLKYAQSLNHLSDIWHQYQSSKNQTQTKNTTSTSLLILAKSLFERAEALLDAENIANIKYQDIKAAIQERKDYISQEITSQFPNIQNFITEDKLHQNLEKISSVIDQITNAEVKQATTDIIKKRLGDIEKIRSTQKDSPESKADLTNTIQPLP